MKLLLDENLSRRIVPFLQSAYPGTTQIALVGLENADDSTIWQYAREQGFVIATRDSDFHERAMIMGHPPQVIWLKIPNPAKSQVLSLLLEQQPTITHALMQENLACLEINMGFKA